MNKRELKEAITDLALPYARKKRKHPDGFYVAGRWGYRGSYKDREEAQESIKEGSEAVVLTAEELDRRFLARRVSQFLDSLG